MSLADLRREARIRKILQNSEERLRKINNLQDFKNAKPDHILNGDLSSDSADGFIDRSLANHIYVESITDESQRSDNFLHPGRKQEVESVIQAQCIQHPVAGINSQLNIFFKNYRLVNVIALAILIRCVNLMAVFLHIYHGNIISFIFSPLIVYHFTEFLVIDKVPVAGLLNVLVLLSNKFGDCPALIFKAISICHIVLQDITLYFCIFIILDKLVDVI